jgi:isopenicillin N synthase-like dioxygenase
MARGAIYPGSFAVNAGDMMKRWTNGRFKSAPHRATAGGAASLCHSVLP